MKLLLPFALTLLAIVACVSAPTQLPPPPNPTTTPSSIIPSVPVPVYSTNPPPGTQFPNSVQMNKRKEFNILFVETNSDLGAKWKMALDDAIENWNNALGYGIFNYSNENINLKIRYLDEIKINDNDNAVGGDYYGNCNYGQINFYNNYKYKKSIAMHELGHSIGLMHSINGIDVMFPSIGKEKNLSSNDIMSAKMAVMENCK